MSSTPSIVSDLHPSPICLGTADLGSTVDRTTSFAMLDAYLDLGGNFLDTAKVYADWLPGERSVSEKLIGEWMHIRRNRQRIILATKGAHPDLAAMHLPRLSRSEIEANLHASLRHLQTDRIDLYWLHRDDPNRPVEDILTILNGAVRAGKILLFGCSNWRVERIRTANDYAAAHGLQGFAASQVMWTMAVVDAPAIGDPTIVVMDDELWRYHRSPANLARFERARQLAARRDLTMTQVVLGYLISQPFPTHPIVGPKTFDQLNDCLTASTVRLEQAEISALCSE